MPNNASNVEKAPIFFNVKFGNSIVNVYTKLSCFTEVSYLYTTNELRISLDMKRTICRN